MHIAGIVLVIALWAAIGWMVSLIVANARK